MPELVPLKPSEWPERRERLIEDYAKQGVTAGRSDPQTALEEARKEFESLLPDGPQTKGHYLYNVTDGGESVGFVWIHLREAGSTENTGSSGPSERSVWIYEILTEERFRRRGYARETLHLVEDKARTLGAASVGLHVFGHNRAARSLYEEFGFETTSIVMRLPLDGTLDKE